MRRVNQGRLFFSNHLEALLICLEKNLFVDRDPFAKRCVVVPSREMGGWVRAQFAERLGIAAHIQTLFLHETLEIALPSKLTLTTRIYEEIASLDYVQGDPRKQMLLAQTLARLFHRYALYGVDFEEDWQKGVWERVYPDLTLRVKADRHFHFFSFSHIPEKLFALLQEHTFYHLSPCAAFWSDLRKEEKEHVFLANLGKLGRTFAQMVEQSVLQTHELYIRQEGQSALHQFQRSMLELEPQRIAADASVQVHIVSTRHREVEVLFHTLKRLDVEPKDVLIMAPDIALYTPYIEALFSHYRIQDMPPTLNRLVHGLELFFALEKRRWSGPALMELFIHPLFYRQWDESALAQIRLWMQQVGIRWGMHESAVSWEQGFDHLLRDLASGEEPLVPYTEAELLGEWIETVRALYEARPHENASLRDWVIYVRSLCDRFFIECDERVWLEGKLTPLCRDEEMPFEPFSLLLEEELKEEGLTLHPNALQTYRFCSLLPMRSIPAKVIWILGMDQEAFPRLDKAFAFDLSRKSHAYAPTRLDFDRYLFLEAVLSARESFIISYCGRDPLDHQERAPSSVVSDFLSFFHLDPVVHPAKSYAADYFNGTLPSTARVDFEMAVAVQKEERVALPFALQITPPPLPEAVVDIADLQRLAKSPLKHYYRHRLGMRFWEDEPLKEEEEFALSAQTLGRIRQEALTIGVEKAIARVQRQGNYPTGLFQRVADMRCAQIETVPAQRYELYPHLKSAVEVEPDLWHIPALRVGKVTVVGRVEGVVQNTLHLAAKSDLRGVLGNWPLLLLFSSLGEAVYFARDKKRKALSFEGGLEPFLRYFFLAKESASPLFPTWVKPIAEGDVERLKKEIAAPAFDAALVWAFSGRSLLDLEGLIGGWQEEAKRLYGEVLDVWF